MGIRNHRKTLQFMDAGLKVLKHISLLTCKDELCNGRHARTQTPALDANHQLMAKCIYCGKKNMLMQRVPVIGVSEDR